MRFAAAVGLVMTITAWVAESGAVGAPADTAVRVPGTALRFGAALERFTLAAGFTATPGADSTLEVRKGVVRFFGVPAQATLTFRDQRLAAAEFAADSVTAATRDYIEDELGHQGFRRRCTRWEPARHVCDWSGRAEVHLEVSGATVRAAMRGPGSAPDAARAPVATTPAADSLVRALALRLHPPTVVDSCSATRPETARRDGIFGRVVVRVAVDTLGAVTDATVAQGVAGLDDAALACARQYRFRPFVFAGRPQPFDTAVTIRFTQ